jgi:alpha-mannosidase
MSNKMTRLISILCGRKSFPTLLCIVLPLLCSAQTPPSGTPRDKAVAGLTAVTELSLPDWRWHADDASILHPEALTFDDKQWQSFKVGDEWSTGPVWFRRWVQIPESNAGYGLRGALLRFRVRISGENPVHLTVFFNGAKAEEGNDLDPIVLTRNAVPGERVLIAVKATVPGGRTGFQRGQLEVEAPSGRPDPRTLLQEFLSAEAMVLAFPGVGREQNLEQAVTALDWVSLQRGDQSAFDRSVQASRDRLRPLAPWLKTFSIRVTGNSHIDMAWLWPWTETVEVVRNTFTTALQLMREYPDFTFTASSAQAYAWMEEKYPNLFEQIRQRVREGRWEPIGGMWVEPDLNMPDGESLVRQLLTGTRYFREKFGVEIRTGWNPDSFGYNWQLPQIYKRSGFDYFVTQKIYWNDTTKFPHKLFWWESPNGSRLLTYFPHDYGNPIDAVRMAQDLAQYAPAMGSNHIMHLYGVGDHGGGPTRSMLENAERWKADDAIYPRLLIGPAQKFFDDLGRKAPQMKIPTWNDELYLEYHRGVYTSQAATKRNNRKNEALLLNAEKFASLSLLWGQPYPQNTLNDAWHKVLFNQFHDVLAGSGVAAVYRDADRDHAEVRHIGEESLTASLAALAAHADTGGPGVPILVVNPLSWARTEVLEVKLQLPASGKEVEVRSATGQTVPAQIAARDPITQELTVRFVAQNVPALGYQVFHAVPATGATSPASAVRAHGLTVENDLVRVTVDAKSGCLTSLYDKKGGGEILAPGACGNLLQAFHDLPREYDAWNVDANFEEQRWNIDHAEEVKLVESGPVRAAVRVVRKFQSSTFTQDIVVTAGSPRVDVHTVADWREKHVLLKAAFPLAVHSDFATYEIPYGSIRRPTTRNTPAEKAKFEVPALRWADLSDSAHGLSILNESKYGYDGRDNVLRITLLRSTAYPDPHADEGRQEFTYSLLPHAATWKEAGTVLRGYELNNPLLVRVVSPHTGALPATHSFVQLDPQNLVLTAMKKAEDGDGIIFRFYEWAGRGVAAHLRLPSRATRAVETNLMEKEEKPLAITEGAVTMQVGPYEIKALKVEFAPKPSR